MRPAAWWWLVGHAFLASGALQAATWTVGPGGSHETIQDAIDTAVAAGGIQDVRVRSGAYSEQVVVSAFWSSGILTVTGGWDAAFAVRTLDPTLTTVDAQTLGRPLLVEPSGTAILVVSGFTLTGGWISGGSAASAGGVWAYPTGSAHVLLDRLEIVDNTTENSAGFAGSAGLLAWAVDDAELVVVRCRVAESSVFQGSPSSAATGVWGGAVDVVAYGTALVQLESNVVESNEVQSTLAVIGGAIRVEAIGDVDVVLLDNVVRDNSTTGTGATNGAGLDARLEEAARFTARRNRFFDNTGSHSGDFQVSLSTQFPAPGASLAFTDSLIAGGSSGLYYQGLEPGVDARFTNLTIADHSSWAAIINGNGPSTSLFNSIAFGGATVLTNTASGSNLVGVDPLFLSPPGRDYHLGTGSPATDGGDDSPPGGLGPSDLDGGPRIAGVKVDQGAYENSLVFRSGFESGDLGDWSFSS